MKLPLFTHSRGSFEKKVFSYGNFQLFKLSLEWSNIVGPGQIMKKWQWQFSCLLALAFGERRRSWMLNFGRLQLTIYLLLLHSSMSASLTEVKFLATLKKIMYIGSLVIINIQFANINVKVIRKLMSSISSPIGNVFCNMSLLYKLSLLLTEILVRPSKIISGSRYLTDSNNFLWASAGNSL